MTVAAAARSASASAMPEAVRIDNLHKRFGSLEVIKGVSLSANEGDVIAIIGGSGSGKSTLLRCINFLETPTSGTISICGEAVKTRPDGKGGSVPSDRRQLERIRTSLGMVFQNFELFPHMSITENLVIAQTKVLGRSKDEANEKGLKLLERVGLKAQASKFPGQLSGGQQQRLCIARTIAVKPEVVLLDEPTSALDPISTAHIEDLIFKLKEDYTIVIVTHNMQQAARVSDYTAYMYLGELIEFGDTDLIFTTPKQKATEDYITGKFG